MAAAETMSETETPSSPAVAAVLEVGTPSPYLHDRGRVLYNPTTGQSLPKDGPGYQALTQWKDGTAPAVDPAVLEHLRAARFLIDDVEAETRRSHLLYVSLETCTSCNHRCPFCPVSVDPREREVMSQELFERIAEETVIVVLGDNDEPHRRDVREIRERFEPVGWDVKSFRIRSRPGSGTFVPEPPPVKELKGCELMGSRPFEHLHVTATAKAVLCCQDYYERLPVGDLKTQTVAEVLGGDAMARLRRWTYGVEEAPADFLCRRCEFAIGQ